MDYSIRLIILNSIKRSKVNQLDLFQKPKETPKLKAKVKSQDVLQNLP